MSFKNEVIQPMLALIGLGVGLGVLPHFDRTEGIHGIVWRPLARPKLWTDFALVWPKKATSPLLREFVLLARQMIGVGAAEGGSVAGL